ncbi:hypothetical protein [Pseudactinotalea sp. Z1748]|uniref:hypothetical protein n=1 Tax=Pseudactinotalea sp. Z1748 TaxID=3413027 RepID=UPI003C79C0FC
MNTTDDARAEAVRKVLRDRTGGCTCHPSYIKRELEAPDCSWHDIERAIPAVLAAASRTVAAETAEEIVQAIDIARDHRSTP